MATRRGGLVPHEGSWNGVFVGTDLIPRNVSLAMERHGTKLNGELSIVVDPRNAVRASVRVKGTYVSGKITLNVTLPRAPRTPKREMKIVGQLIRISEVRQAIVATVAPAAATVKGSAIGKVPLHGTLCLATAAVPVTADDGGGWSEENPEQG